MSKYMSTINVSLDAVLPKLPDNPDMALSPTHIASDFKAKNYDVQPLRKGSVDHKRLRSDETLLPSQDITRFRKKPSIPHFFSPLFAGGATNMKSGEQGIGQETTFSLWTRHPD